MDEEYSNPCIIRRGFLANDDPFVPVSEMGRFMGESGVFVLMVSDNRNTVSLADHVILMDSYRTRSVEASAGSSTADTPYIGTRYPVSKNIIYKNGCKEVSVTSQGVRW